jgi:hypothetical protein
VRFELRRREENFCKEEESGYIRGMGGHTVSTSSASSISTSSTTAPSTTSSSTTSILLYQPLPHSPNSPNHQSSITNQHQNGRLKRNPLHRLRRIYPLDPIHPQQLRLRACYYSHHRQVPPLDEEALEGHQGRCCRAPPQCQRGVYQLLRPRSWVARA